MKENTIKSIEQTLETEVGARVLPSNANGTGFVGTVAERQVVSTGKFGLATVEESRVERMSSIFAIVMFVFVVVTLLVALVIGTNVYRALSTERSNASNLRFETSLLLNNIRMNDETNAVGVGNGPEGRSLVLIERLDSGTYETRIYLYRGNIVQEYSLATSPYDPERASIITASSVFEFNYSSGLLTVLTDTGRTHVALRSVEGGR